MGYFAAMMEPVFALALKAIAADHASKKDVENKAMLSAQNVHLTVRSPAFR